MYLGYVIIWRFITYDNIVSSLLLAVMSLLILVIIFRIDIIDLKMQVIKLFKNYKESRKEE